MLGDFLPLKVLGQSVLIGALISLIFQWIWVGYCAVKRDEDSVLVTFRGSAIFQLALMTIGMAVLVGAYVTNDFSLKNVFENSHTHTPLLYRITGSWGNHEGSMLLWLWIMSLYGVLMGGVARRPRSTFQKQEFSLRAASQGLYQFLFMLTLIYVVILSNPFEAFQGSVSQGLELNPILQDPALAIHPPTLYAGYVGFGVVFALALGGAVSRAPANLWLGSVQRWTLVAWSLLTLGIALGSWWAYYELGWGGWWFWDPVENASLMPWLSATALVHLVKLSRLHVSQNSGVSLLKSTYFLAVLTFTLCLLGTFLVRSGSLSSVHSFAQDPGRGVALLSFTLLLGLAGCIGFVFLLKGKKPQQDADKNQEVGGVALNQDPSVDSLLTLESAFSLQTAFFITLLITVILGTIYPLCLEALTGKAISVGAPYFHKTFVPISFLVLTLMGVSFFLPPLYRGVSSWKMLWAELERPALLTALWMLMWSFTIEPFSPVSILGSGLSFWVVGTSLKAWFKAGALKGMRHQPSFFAHIGVAVMVFGMTVDHSFRDEQTVAIGIDETIQFKGFALTLKDIERVREDTFMGERGTLEVCRDGKFVSHLRPEKRFYPSHQVLTTETAIYPHGLSNLYVALGGVLPGPKWTLRLYHHPLVICLWLGAIFIAFGGLVAFSLLMMRGERAKKIYWKNRGEA